MAKPSRPPIAPQPIGSDGLRQMTSLTCTRRKLIGPDGMIDGNLSKQQFRPPRHFGPPSYPPQHSAFLCVSSRHLGCEPANPKRCRWGWFREPDDGFGSALRCRRGYRANLGMTEAFDAAIHDLFGSVGDRLVPLAGPSSLPNLIRRCRSSGVHVTRLDKRARRISFSTLRNWICRIRSSGLDRARMRYIA